MFRFGRTNGYLTIVLIVLAVLPLIEAFFVIPQLPDSVAMAFGAGGEPTRYASRYELFLAPGICLLLGVGMILTARRQAGVSIPRCDGAHLLSLDSQRARHDGVAERLQHLPARCGVL